MRGYMCYFEFDIENGNCIWIEDTEKGILELIQSMIVDSGDCDIEHVISRTVVAEIITEEMLSKFNRNSDNFMWIEEYEYCN